MEKSGEGIETKGVARAPLHKRVRKSLKTKGIDGKTHGKVRRPERSDVEEAQRPLPPTTCKNIKTKGLQNWQFVIG